MSDAVVKSRSRKRGATEDGGEATRTDAEASTAAVAAAPAAAASDALGAAADAVAVPASASDVVAAQQTHATAGVQPPPEQMSKKQRRSPSFCSPLDQLATVELQLCLQWLEKRSKLKAARCSRSLLRAANDSFAWQGPAVAVSSRGQPQLGSFIRQSLLRHAPIALTLDADLPAAEMAAIPRLRELLLSDGSPVQLSEQLPALPSLQGLQRLRLNPATPLSTLPLLPSLPALHTLECFVLDGPVDWRWLPAMPALTELDLTSSILRPISQPTLDAIGQCARLKSLRLRDPVFKAGAFERFCSAPAMRRLRHLDLRRFPAQTAEPSADAQHSAFSTLARLESLHFKDVRGVDRLLPQLAHAPALRTLTIACAPVQSFSSVHESTQPSREALARLLTAAPLLLLRLQMAVSMAEWRTASVYSSVFVCERMDEQWREFQRMAAQLERVTIVGFDD